MIGLDAVDIARFAHWHQYSRKQLERVFHPEELAYAFENPQKTVERLAVRFAAKEAFYKALSDSKAHSYSLLYICKNVRVAHRANGAPYLIINPELWDMSYSCHLTLTHTGKTAIALVLLSRW